MSVDATMAVLYAQTNLAANVSNAAAVAPQASVAMSRVLAAAMAKQEQQQIGAGPMTYDQMGQVIVGIGSSVRIWHCRLPDVRRTPTGFQQRRPLETLVANPRRWIQPG